jgi:hypothetical protein
MDSPFSEHLDSCYIASDDEIPRIKALIQQKLGVIGNIDKQIEDVENSLAALKAQREANKIFIQKHRALIAPIKRLPPDILTTVFLACLPAVELAEASLTRNHPAVVISHVCHQWRQLTLDTPLLWSRIQLILPFVNYEPYHHQYHPANDEAGLNREVAALFDSAVERLCNMASIWLARSKGCPLTIFMEASEGGVGGYVMPSMSPLVFSMLKSLERLVDLVCGESRRWEQVRFKIAMSGTIPESQLTRLLFLTPRDVPILRKATITITSRDHIGIQTNANEESPNLRDQIAMGTIHGQALRSLALVCPKAATDLKVLRVNWAGLTELMLRPYLRRGAGMRGGTHLTVDEALTLLGHCPNLRRCNIAVMDESIPPAWNTPPAVWDPLTAPASVAPAQGKRPVCRLPHLHSLILRDRSSRTDRLASALDLPSLCSFNQTGPALWTPLAPSFIGPVTLGNELEGENVWYDFPLLGWVQRFGRTITSIDFRHVGVPQRAVEQSLEELPNLINLTIRSPFSESLKANLPTWSSSGCDSFLQKLTPEVIEDRDTVTVSPNCLCPKLEELALKSLVDSDPVRLAFSEASVVEFLAGRAKASLKTVPEDSRVSKLRYVSVRFSNTQAMDLKQELSRRGCNLEGLVGEWDYPVPPKSYSYLSRQPTINNSTMDEIW